MAFEKLARDFAAFALKQCRKQTAREEKAHLKRKTKYDRWLALQPYDVQRASLIATLRGWKLNLVHVDDLADAFRIGALIGVHSQKESLFSRRTMSVHRRLMTIVLLQRG